MIARDLTKDEEITKLRLFIDSLPVGYVQTIMLDIQPDIERAIRNDFGFISFREQLEQIEEHRQQMIAGKAQLDSVKTQIRDLEYQKQRLQSGLTDLRDQIRKLSNF